MGRLFLLSFTLMLMIGIAVWIPCWTIGTFCH